VAVGKLLKLDAPVCAIHFAAEEILKGAQGNGFTLTHRDSLGGSMHGIPQ
jgi:hypothetical protein